MAQQGTLEPDTYDLNITCSGGASISPGSPDEQGEASYDIHFVLASGTDARAPVAARESIQAFPNPFRAGTRLVVPDGVKEIRVLDARGRVVRTLPAAPSLPFDGRDETGRPLASGVYWMQPVGPVEVGSVKVVRLN